MDIFTPFTAFLNLSFHPSAVKTAYCPHRSAFTRSITVLFALSRSQPESWWHKGMMSVAVDQKRRNSDSTLGSSIHWNGKFVEIIARRNCLCTISACLELKGTWITQKNFSWDCMNDLSIFVSNFFFAGFAFWSSSTLLSVLASSNSLFPFPFTFLTALAAFHVAAEAFGHGLPPPFPRTCATIESLTLRTPPRSLLQAIGGALVRMKIVHGKLYLPSMTHDCDDNLGFPLLSSSIASFSRHSLSIQPWQCTRMCDFFCLSPVKKCFQIGSLWGALLMCQRVMSSLNFMHSPHSNLWNSVPNWCTSGWVTPFCQIAHVSHIKT